MSRGGWIEPRGEFAMRTKEYFFSPSIFDKRKAKEDMRLTEGIECLQSARNARFVLECPFIEAMTRKSVHWENSSQLSTHADN